MIHPELLSAVQHAGAELLHRFESREMHIRNKSDDEHGAADIVTDADAYSEQLLFQALRKAYPSDSIQGEEGSSHKGGPSVWHVDPLDGTSNFVHRIPLWGISVGRATNGVPDVGIIYLPVQGLLFVAESGRGATCNGQSIHVSKRMIKEALYWGAGYGDGKPHHHDSISREVHLTKIVDSSAYELCSIARGDADIYELNNVPHDVVAGIVVVTEAGGKATDWEGKPYTTKSKTVLITNGVVHADVVKLLKA